MLALSLVLTCMPAPAESQTFKGPAGVELQQKALDFRAADLTMVENGKEVWKVPNTRALFEATFSADGRWVATADTLRESKVRVYGPKGVLTTFDPLELLTPAEKQKMSATSCGPAWFGGLKFDGAVVIVTVSQAPRRPPIYAPDPAPGLEVRFDVETKKMTRNPASATPAPSK